MASSQEKLTEKYCNIIEKTFQDTIANENTKILLGEYKAFLLDELNFQKESEENLQENLDKLVSVEDSALVTKCSKLQEAVAECEKYIDQLRDKTDNLTIQFIADTETLKIEKAEKEQQIISSYDTEVKRLKTQLKNNKKEHEKIEQEIKNQITLEIATQNTRLEEIRGNLQRQIVEKNSVLIKMQNEYKELRNELSKLKAQEKSTKNEYKNTNTRSNVIEFNNESLVQRNKTSVSNKEFANQSTEYTTAIPNHQGYLEYANSNAGLTANNLLPNKGLNQRTINNNINKKSNSNKNYVSSTSNKEQFLSKYNSSKSVTVSQNFSDQTTSNLAKHNQLANKEISYFAPEYNQLNKTSADYYTDIDIVNAKIVEVDSKPSSVLNPAALNENKKHDFPPTIKQSTVEAPGFSISNSVMSSRNNDSKAENSDFTGKDLINRSVSSEYNTNHSDVPRKEPTVYISETRKTRTYGKSARFTHKGNYGNK